MALSLAVILVALAVWDWAVFKQITLEAAGLAMVASGAGADQWDPQLQILRGSKCVSASVAHIWRGGSSSLARSVIRCPGLAPRRRSCLGYIIVDIKWSIGILA